MLGRSSPQSRFALQLFFFTSALFAVGWLLGVGLVYTIRPPRPTHGTFIVPAAFLFSTALLILCSVFLHLAVIRVRRERQRAFHRSLLCATACGTAFVGVQAFGLWCIVQNLQADRNAGEAQLGATALVLGAAGLHALHVIIALMFLAYVTLHGLQDRYDHEYSFGVVVCAWFWHILGVLWIVILGVYGIVSGFLTIPRPPL